MSQLKRKLKRVKEIVANKKTQQFANLVRSYRKSYIGKGPEQVKVFFKDNWAICHMTGSLSKVENFYLRNKDFQSMLKYGRTEEIKELYKQNLQLKWRNLLSKFRKTFTDVNLEDDEVVSIFVFDKSIE